jgi:outer membrane protein assembly factor BamB
MATVWRLNTLFILAIAIVLLPADSNSYPTVYPTGTTIYQPDKTWNGYTIFPTPGEKGVVLIDMNGNEVKRWADVDGIPARMFPGGGMMAGMTTRRPHQEYISLVQVDWDGNEVWRFDRTEQIETEDGETVWAARLHHDWQREGSPAGYYQPGSEPMVTGGRTLILAHKNVTVPAITDKRLEDDYILEVSWSGEVLWEWLASDHVDELGFSEDARNAIHRSVNWNEARQSADWLHINSMTYVGPNRWYDEGDERFHPDNVIISSRSANIVAIIGRSGDIVWRMGPDYRESAGTREIGQVIGQHHPHIIPKGLPGAGNLMVFDNGGAAGYGESNPNAPTGRNIVARHSSRVLEINPVTFEKVWEYSIAGLDAYRFLSHYVSSAQRLPNGNTLITEGADGRLFEVTSDGEIVWEYMNPYFDTGPVERNPKAVATNRVFRAYRFPYDWVPQLERPMERPVVPPARGEFRIEPQ